MEKRVIWIVTELFPPEETSTAYILGEIANALAQVYQVCVICGPAVYDKKRLPSSGNPFRLDPSIRLIRTNSINADKNKIIGKIRSLLGMSFRLYGLSKKHVKRGDKVLVVTNPALLLPLLSRLKRNIGFELTILVHDVFPENTIPCGIKIPAVAYAFMKNAFDKAYSTADRLIVIGRDMANVLRNKTKNRVHIEIVENWADTEQITPIPFPSTPVRVQYAGNIGRVQGLEKVVNTLPKDVELHFYGTGAMESTLIGFHRSNVFFHGPYRRSQQQCVIGECHVSIVTLADGMYGLGVPSKTYNILAAGRPIIYFGPEDGEIGMLIKEHRIGYIGWPNKWDIDELKEMGLRARQLAESSYSKQIILSKFLNAIR